MAGKTRHRNCKVGIHIASSVRNQRENAGAQFLWPCHLPHHTHNFRLLFKPIICQFLKRFIIYVYKCACAWVCVPECLRLQIPLELDCRRLWAANTGLGTGLAPLQGQTALFAAKPFLQPPYFPLFILSEIPTHGVMSYACPSQRLSYSSGNRHLQGHVPSRSFQTQASWQRREAGQHSRLHSGHGKKFSLTKTLWEAKAGF